jgi:tetratricopeptide (TPR) repeat protein
MSEMFAQLGRLIDLGEREKVPVAARRHMLAKAVHLLEEGDRVGSLSKAVACFKSLQEEFFQVVETRAGAIMELADSASQGADISSVTALVDKGKEAMERGRIEEALRILDEAHAAIRPILAKAVEAIVAAQRERDEWLQATPAPPLRGGDQMLPSLCAATARGAGAAPALGEGARESEMEVVLNT